MNTEQKVDIIVNILPLIPAVVKGIQEATELYNRMIQALRDGITPDELNSAINERDAVLERIIEKTT